MKIKMDTVLETVAAFPAPATDEELNSKITSIVEKVADKQLSAVLTKQTDRLQAIEKSLENTIKNLADLSVEIGKRHGFEIGERDQRIRDLSD